MSVRAESSERPILRRSNAPRVTLGLHDLRMRAGLSMKEVEERTGVRPAAISEIERTLRLPRPHELRALAGCYGVDPDDGAVVVEYRWPVEEAVS